MKKIMFNDRYGLTQAVIEGRKTMTRRVLSGYPLTPSDRIEEAYVRLDGSVDIIANGGESLMAVKCRYRVGEIVAVAQDYSHCGGMMSNGVPRWEYISKVAGCSSAGWRNKMFVRADLMPHQIRINGIRVERLQDISDEDCLKEGIVFSHKAQSYYVGYHNWLGKTPREAFAALIDKVSGRGTWESNPYVVVYEFKLVK